MEMEKLIIAGAGPAGVSAALYAVRSGITPLVLHKGGGALEKAVKIENYYGLPQPVSGAELYQNGLEQLKSFQVPVMEEELLAVEYDGDYTVHTTVFYNNRTEQFFNFYRTEILGNIPQITESAYVAARMEAAGKLQCIIDSNVYDLPGSL